MPADLRSDGCSCHINPPCSFCMSLDEEEYDAYANGGMDALRELHQRREDELPDDGVTEEAMRGMSMDEALASLRAAAALEGCTVVVPDDPPIVPRPKEPFRWSFWLASYRDGSRLLVCKLRATREEALEAAMRQRPELGIPRDIQTLPYPNCDVQPSEDYPHSHPGFCYASLECAGRTACPKRVPCTD